MKSKNCKICHVSYIPNGRSQKVCSIKCALRLVQEYKIKENRRRKREFNNNDRKYLTKKVQATFNKYIRLRDKGKPCISCGRLTGCKLNAGHYKSSGSHPALKFEPDNCHLQCEHCNTYSSGNLIKYRINLIDKVGLKRVEWLEGAHPQKRHTIEELRKVRMYFIKCIKETSGERK